MTQEDELLISYVKNNIGELINIIDNRVKNDHSLDYSDLRICGYALNYKRVILVGSSHYIGSKVLNNADVVLKEYPYYAYILEKYIVESKIVLK